MSDRDQELMQQGIDIWMIRENLSRSPEERIAQHQDTLNTILALEQIREQNRARPSSAA